MVGSNFNREWTRMNTKLENDPQARYKTGG